MTSMDFFQRLTFMAVGLLYILVSVGVFRLVRYEYHRGLGLRYSGILFGLMVLAIGLVLAVGPLLY